MEISYLCIYQAVTHDANNDLLFMHNGLVINDANKLQQIYYWWCKNSGAEKYKQSQYIANRKEAKKEYMHQ